MKENSLSKEELLLKINKMSKKIKKLEDKTELRYKILFDLSSDASLLVENYKISECNQAAIELFGYDNKLDMINQQIFELSPTMQPDGRYSQDKGMEILNTAIKNEKKSFEWLHSKKNGDIFWAEVVLVRLILEGRDFFNLSIRDITKRKKMQMELEKKESIYKNLFESNHAIILLIDPETGAIPYANPAACNFYGYTHKEITNLHISDINCTFNKEQLFEEMDKVLKDEKRRYEFKNKLKSGEVRDVEAHTGKIYLNSKYLLYSIVHDITDKKIAINRIEESEKLFRTLFNKINDGIFLHAFNLNSNFIEVNETACNILGYSREELLQLTPEKIDKVKTDHKLDKFEEFKKYNNVKLETKLIRKDGNQVPFEMNSHSFDLFEQKVILTIARDITERKSIEKTLRDNEERYRSLLDLIPDAVFVNIDNNIAYTNQVGLNIIGFEKTEEVIGKNPFDLVKIHRDSLKDAMIKKKAFVKNKKTRFSDLKFIRKIDEKIFEMEVGIFQIQYSKKDAQMIILRDISDRKKAEEYKRLFDEAKEYNNLKTQFFANISHELRTPLNLILGTTQLIEMNSTNFNKDYNAKYNKYVKILKQNCYRLLRLINNIIDITKIDSGYLAPDFKNCDIIRIVEDITLSVADFLNEKNIIIEFDTNVEEKIISCDPDMIERMIMNLLSNATKFMKDEGIIKVNIFAEEDKVSISVIDYGIGIPQEKIKEIFQLFRLVDKSLTRNHEGSGIGLYLVNSLVNMHHGKITVNSEYLKGSEFTITLPVRNIEPTIEEINCFNCEKLNDSRVEIVKVEFSDIYS